VEQAFRWAREADPEAQLFYNDYNLESDPAKAERAAAFLGDLLERGVPVDGVGLQYHTSAEDAPDPAQAAAVIERFNRMGLTVHITELDVGIPPAADAAALRRQAEVYAEVVSVALAAADCPAVFTWGLTDRYSWVPGFTNGEKDHALLLDRQYRPKPAHAAVCAALRQG
jgi:endo-1,4-beta-xylanase